MEIYNEIIAPVIEELVHDYSSSENVEISYVYDRIRKVIPKVIEEYFSGQRPQIDYSNFFVRIGYLHRLVPGLVYNFRNLVKKAIELGYFKERIIDIMVFGGGPGTELLAVSTVLKGKDINFCLTDKVQSWADCWDYLKTKIKERLPDAQISIDHSFLKIDITDINDFYENKIRLCKNKYFFINYLISELYDNTNGFIEFLRAIIEYKRKRDESVVILLADRSQSEIEEEIERIKEDLKLDQKYFNIVFEGCPEDFDLNLELIRKLDFPKRTPFNSIQYIFESYLLPF